MFNENEIYNYDLDERGMNRYVAKVFGWMFIGLFVTALTTAFLYVGAGINAGVYNFVNFLLQYVFIIAMLEVALVMFFSFRIKKMNPATAKLVYLFYAVLNGITVGFIGLAYAGTVVITAFALTAVSFGTMAVYGLITNSDLTKMGNILKMALLGLIVISIANIFMGNSTLDFMICIAGLFIFLGLTAHDTKKIKEQYHEIASNPSNENLAKNISILGALMLYLDFINIFIFFLRILDRREG